MPTEVYINAISYHLPERAVYNGEILEDYHRYCEKPDPKYTIESIYERCQVRKRYQSAEGETAKDLGNAAAKKLFSEWHIDKSEIDYIIFVSDALEHKGPTTACIMQDDLGLKKSVAAIDILHGCTGFIYGLSIAKALILSNQVNNVLLITGDLPTKVVHPEDIDLRAIFSDAAAATFISNQKTKSGINAKVGNFIFGTDGSGEDDLKTTRSGTKNPATSEWLKQFENVPHRQLRGRLQMKSSKIFLFALRTVPKLVEEMLQKEKLTKDDVDLFILHQANGQMLDFIRKRMKVPKEKFINNIENIGNTVSATIPIALYETHRQGKIEKHDKILLAGFGIGLSWGGTFINF